MNRNKNKKKLADEARNRLALIRIIFAFLSMLLYTAFIVIMLYNEWGSSVYLYVIMGLISLYVVIYATIIIVRQVRGKRMGNSIKDYRSGLKILRHMLTIISLWLTISVFSLSLFASDMNSVFQLIVLILTFLWAAFQIIFQVKKMVKRHNKK